MLTINEITADAQQKHTVNLDNGKTLVLELMYYPTQLGWYLNVDYDDGAFKVNGIRICTHYNLLQQWTHIVPVGIMVRTDGNGEPMLVEDFLTGRSSLSVLQAEDLEELEALRGF